MIDAIFTFTKTVANVFKGRIVFSGLYFGPVLISAWLGFVRLILRTCEALHAYDTFGLREALDVACCVLAFQGLR